MPSPLVPTELLQKSDKILFIAHLALGDFAYLQNCFRAFAQAYPHLRLHLWVDEVRRTGDASKWPMLKAYSLYDWVRACSFFDKVYDQTYSPQLLRQSVAEARAEQYPLVVSLATLRPAQYAALARAVGPRAFVVGMRQRFSLLLPHRELAYRRLDAALPLYRLERANPQHISGVYAGWFADLFGVQVGPHERLPYVEIPAQWRQRTDELLRQWDCSGGRKRVFVNSFAKTKKRCWPMPKVAALIREMQARDEWRDACFIVNAMPHEMAGIGEFLRGQGLQRTHAFSAERNFFELPALLERCDLIVSVETAVMHLANAVQVPVVALMRQKNPEWVPLDAARSTVITAARRRDWVDAVTVEQVMEVL
ncbi:MAG: glycosyltransferase family 9 protein [Burkholderiaceae bacterium]